MNHAAVTAPDQHLFAERIARGGVGQAGVSADPFDAWIGDWQMRSTGEAIERMEITASAQEFSYELQLIADGPLALHVQNELGILGETQRIRAQVSEVESNAISVRTELQADCFSGVWARYARDDLGTLEPGDISEAMNAAKQIGDDTLQRNAGQAPQPHTFSHGTSAQRQAWFSRGYETGAVDACDTFKTASL